MELISSAAVLAPFTIAYQILGGSRTWWFAYGLIGVVRPLFAVPLVRILHKHDEEAQPVNIVLSLAVAYMVLSFMGAAMLWVASNEALSALSDPSGTIVQLVGLSLTFTSALYCSLGWFVASGVYSILEDIARNERQNVKKVSQTLQDAVGNWIPAFLGPAVGSISQVVKCLSPRCMKASWESCFPYIILTLEMDAVVSLYYHAVKMAWLGQDQSFPNLFLLLATVKRLNLARCHVQLLSVRDPGLPADGRIAVSIREGVAGGPGAIATS